MRGGNENYGSKCAGRAVAVATSGGEQTAATATDGECWEEEENIGPVYNEVEKEECTIPTNGHS